MIVDGVVVRGYDVSLILAEYPQVLTMIAILEEYKRLENKQ